MIHTRCFLFSLVLKRVATALGTFLVEFMPPECKNKGNLSVLHELCSVALSILKNNDSESQARFKPVFRFLTAFVSAHGYFAEHRAQEALKGQVAPDENSGVVVILTDLLLAAVDEFQTASVAASATNTKKQGQGQPAYESKTLPAPKGDAHIGEEMCEMLSLFESLLERCPSYFFQLPSAPGLEGQNDLLHRKATETAVGLLNESDAETSKCAMAYLETLVRLLLFVTFF